MADDKTNIQKNKTATGDKPGVLAKSIDGLRAANEKFGQSTDRLVDATVAGATLVSQPIVAAIDKASQASETLTRSESLQKLKAAVAERANFEYLGGKLEQLGTFISGSFSKLFGNFSLLPPGLPSLKDIGANLLKLFGLVGLIALLKSDKFKKFVEDTKEGETLLSPLYKFFTETFPNAFKNIGDDFEAFKNDPSFETFTNLFKSGGTIALGLGGIIALFAPLKTMKFLSKTILRFTKMFLPGGLIGRTISRASTQLMNALTGTKLNKAGRATVTSGAQKGQFAKSGARGVKAATKGALRLIPGVGLAATAIFGVFDGITAAMNEAKKENATKMTIAREATAGVLSGLTFGLISQESISGVMTKTGDFFRSMFAAVPSFDEVKEFSSQAFEATKTFFKNAFDQVPSLDQLKETFSNEGFLAATGSFFDGVLANVPGYDTVKGFLKDAGKSAMDFASKINDMLPSVDDLMAFLPSKEDILKLIDNITPDFLKADTPNEKIIDLTGDINKAQAKIEEHKAEIAEGDMRTATGFSRTKQIEKLEAEIAEMKAERAQQQTIIQNNIDSSSTSSVSNVDSGTKTTRGPISFGHPLYGQAAN